MLFIMYLVTVLFSKFHAIIMILMTVTTESDINIALIT